MRNRTDLFSFDSIKHDCIKKRMRTDLTLLFLLFFLTALSCPFTVMADTVFCHEDQELAEDMRPYFTPSSSYYGISSQGMCAAGDYIIYTRYSSDRERTTYVVLEAGSRREVEHSSFFTQHSNSLTYNPDRQEVVSVSNNHAYVFSFYNHHLTLNRDVIMNHNCCKIAYIPSKKVYYLGTSNTIYETTDFTYLNKAFDVPQYAVNQGMACDGRSLYIVWYSVGHNILAVYGLDGSYQGVYSLTSDKYREVEEIDFLNESMLVSIANSENYNGLYRVACKHQYSSWEISRAATCDQTGLESRACRICGKAELRTIPATGVHVPGSWEVKRPATCENSGYRVKNCLQCGRIIRQETLPAAGHDYSGWEEMEESTVLTAGYRKHQCRICEKIEYKESSFLPATIRIVIENERNQIRVYLNKGDRITSWLSDNPQVAEVDESGHVTPKGHGHTRITVSSAGGASSRHRAC